MGESESIVVRGRVDEGGPGLVHSRIGSKRSRGWKRQMAVEPRTIAIT